jgi:hypothetical protein
VNTDCQLEPVPRQVAALPVVEVWDMMLKERAVILLNNNSILKWTYDYETHFSKLLLVQLKMSPAVFASVQVGHASNLATFMMTRVCSLPSESLNNITWRY